MMRANEGAGMKIMSSLDYNNKLDELINERSLIKSSKKLAL